MDELQQALLNARIMPERSEIIATLKQLEALQCGKFIAGRRGRVSRFEWSVDCANLGRAATGENVKVEYVQKVKLVHAAKVTEGYIRHNYQVRPDFRLTVTLPEDLTVSEAKRIGVFLQTLPFGPETTPPQKLAA